MDREIARLERDLMANNDLDRLVGAMCTPKEVKNILGRYARQLVYGHRISNTDPVVARKSVEAALRGMAEQRGYVRFGLNKTVGNLVGKVMAGYKQGYDLVQPKLEKAKERFENSPKYRYWGFEEKEAFLRQYWGSEPN